jgi:SSS family solute:Na+ symporter
MLLYGLYQHFHNFGTDQTQVQLYLTAKTTKQAVRSAFISGLACVPVWGLFFFLGTAIWGYYQLTHTALPAEIVEKTDRIFPYFIMTKLPTGIIGLVLAALLSSAMSTLSGGLNSASTVFTNDLFKKMSPNSSGKVDLFVGRTAVTIAGALSLLVAGWLTTVKGEALVIYYTAFSIFAGGILGLFFLAFLSKRANKKGAIVGIVACLIAVSWASLTKNGLVDLGKWNYNLHPYLIGLLSHVTVFVVGYVASLFIDDPENEGKYINPFAKEYRDY